MQENLSIRQLDNSFSEKIINLILPIQKIEFNVPITLNDQPDLSDIEGFYIKPGGNFFGAIYNGELIGTIALVNTKHNAGAIRKMFVKKEYRGKELGVAQQLFNVLKDDCKQKNINDLYLGTVDLLKAAHRFYERNGFEKIDETLLPGYFPKANPDDVFYHLHLKQETPII